MLSGFLLALVPQLVGLKHTMSPSILKTHILGLSGRLRRIIECTCCDQGLCTPAQRQSSRPTLERQSLGLRRLSPVIKTRDSWKKSVGASPVCVSGQERDKGTERRGSRSQSLGSWKYILGSTFPQVQLSESKRELTELRSALRVLQKEKEQLQEEKQVRTHDSFPLDSRIEDLRAGNLVSSCHLLA